MCKCDTCVDSKNKLFCNNCVEGVKRRKLAREKHDEQEANLFLRGHKSRVYPNYNSKVSHIKISRYVR